MRKSFHLLARLALLLTLLAGAAQAHAILLSFKIDGQDVVLQYNGRVDVARSRLTLLDKDGGNPRKLESLAGEDAASLRTHLGALPPGSYTLRWEVLSVDGHISRGDQPLVLPAP
jgi:methionine-rich copper-binding protein CopC